MIGREPEVKELNLKALKLAKEVAVKTGTLMAGNIIMQYYGVSKGERHGNRSGTCHVQGPQSVSDSASMPNLFLYYFEKSVFVNYKFHFLTISIQQLHGDRIFYFPPMFIKVFINIYIPWPDAKKYFY